MPRHVSMPSHNETWSSAELAAAIRACDFSPCAATVVGCGKMGAQFLKALQFLGVKRIRVCSLSEVSLDPLKGASDISIVPGGFRALRSVQFAEELAIVAIPIAELVPAAEHLAACGYRKMLIEKPVSLWADQIEALAGTLEQRGVDAACAYNRVAYPSFHEAKARARQEGGITSCTYTFTEFVHRLDPKRYTADEMVRWGIANSLHVMSMAHGLIGPPAVWSVHRSGSAVAWHPAGSVFVGSGLSDQRIPFAYHADWGSTGRWSVEIHTAQSSYRLCPLEQLFRRTSATGEWEEIPLVTLAPDIKVGFVEQVAGMLSPEVRQHVPLISLRETVRLTRYGEEVFGYGRVA